MSADHSTPGPSRRLRGLDPAALMAQGLGAPAKPARGEVPVEVPGYEILGRLGEGGMGEVFLARQLSLDREVAVKVVRRELLTEEWFLERLEREARILGRLRNPHLVTVHDFLRLPDGTAAVVMELVEGGNLRDRLRVAPGGLPLAEALRLAGQVAAALAAAHAAGVVHRDVKPENILLDADGQTRVTDFGMALSLTSGAARLTRTGAAAGTPGYFAPEQFTGAAPDHRGDIYSFGALLYEMLTGRLPLGSFDAPRKSRPELSPRLEELLLRSLKPAPAERPAGMDEWLRALSSSGRAEPAGPPADRPRRIGRRTAVFGGLAAGLASGAVWFWLRRKEGGQPLADGPQAAAVPVNLPWETLGWPQDLAAATIAGGWRQEGATLVSGESICLLAVARTMPAAFDLKFTFRRLGGAQSVGVFFRHPSGHGSCELDGWSRHRSGVQAISGRTTQAEGGFEFAAVPDRDHELGLELRPGEARVSVDGELKRSYPLAGETLTVVAPWGWTPGPDAPALALGAYQSPTRFHRLLWRDRSAG